VYELADKWKKPASEFTPTKEDVKGLTANQFIVFLERVMEFELSAESFRTMGQVYGFADSANIEVTNLYFRLGLKVGDRSAIEPTVKLLGEIGRMKFVRPL
jgi:leukotriene-A4 hydrolase